MHNQAGSLCRKKKTKKQLATSLSGHSSIISARSCEGRQLPSRPTASNLSIRWYLVRVCCCRRSSFKTVYGSSSSGWVTAWNTAGWSSCWGQRRCGQTCPAPPSPPWLWSRTPRGRTTGGVVRPERRQRNRPLVVRRHCEDVEKTRSLWSCMSSKSGLPLLRRSGRVVYLYSTAHKTQLTIIQLEDFLHTSLFPEFLPHPIGGFINNIFRELNATT